MAREDVLSLIGERVSIGLSQIIGVTVIAGLNAISIKKFSGGSLEIGGISLNWGSGYLFNSNEIVNIQVAGTFYLAATGSTVVAMVLKGRTSGFE